MTDADRREAALAARRGDVGAMRRLHGLCEQPQTDLHYEAFIEHAAPAFFAIIERDVPRQRRPTPGAIHFHRLHALALDRLDELLAHLLPDGSEGISWGGRWCWIGAHPLRPEPVHVCLLVGCWNEPNTGRAGLDLVSLYAHMFGVSPGRAAHLLAAWLGAEVRSYAA